MKFSSRQVTVMVVALCAAIILAPVAVWAATAVNISDPQSSSRIARVSSDGFLRVESRAAWEGAPFNAVGAGLSGLGFRKLYETTKTRLAITDMSLSADTSTAANDPTITVRVEFVGMVRTSGTAPCNYNASGWTQRTLRWFSVSNGDTKQMTFGGSPLLLSASTGQRICVGFFVWVYPSNTTVFGAVGGYTTTP